MTSRSRSALAATLDRRLAEAMPRMVWLPGVCALVVDTRTPDATEVALERVCAALAAGGQAAGRRLVLVVPDEGHVAPAALCARYARAAGASAIAHDPARSPRVTLGRDARGAALEVNDELREAELVIALHESGDAPHRDAQAIHAWLARGLGPAGAPPHDDGTLHERLSVDGLVLWRPLDDERWWADAGPPLEVAARG